MLQMQKKLVIMQSYYVFIIYYYCDIIVVEVSLVQPSANLLNFVVGVCLASSCHIKDAKLHL